MFDPHQGRMQSAVYHAKEPTGMLDIALKAINLCSASYSASMATACKSYRERCNCEHRHAQKSSNFNSQPEKEIAMKASTLIAAIVACAISAPVVFAQEKSAPAKPPMSMDMDKHMPQMQEHMQAMQENMKSMRGMGGPMMMGMMGSKPGAAGPGMMGGEPKQRQEMMEKRMEMMQMMMEQMVQHDQATEHVHPK